MEILNYKDTKIGLFYFLKNTTTTNITFFIFGMEKFK